MHGMKMVYPVEPCKESKRRPHPSMAGSRSGRWGERIKGESISLLHSLAGGLPKFRACCIPALIIILAQAGRERSARKKACNDDCSACYYHVKDVVFS